MTEKFKQLLEVSEDIEMEWSLFRTATISSAVESCGQKRLRMAASSEKKTPWWNREVKEAIRAKEDAFRALLQNRSSSDFAIPLFRGTKICSSGSKNVQRTPLGGIWSSVGFQLIIGKYKKELGPIIHSSIAWEKYKYHDLYQGFNLEHPPG